MECSSIFLQREKIDFTEAITGFSSLFTKKNIFSFQNIDNIEEKKYYFADRPSVFFMLSCP